MLNDHAQSGRTCSAIVIGNGPSARLLDFEELRSGHVASVGMNAAYRYWDRIDFRPTYYICMDTVVIMSHADRIAELIREGRIRKFFLRDDLQQKFPALADHERVLWFGNIDRSKHPVFDTDWITTGSWAVRWMAHEGMRLIATIGIDANYVEILTESRRLGAGTDLRLEITKTPKFNPNYFFDDYQKAGDRYNIPNDPDYKKKHGQLVHIDALAKARDDIQRLGLGVRIVDCSPLSDHGVFDKDSLHHFFRGMRFPVTTSFFLGASSEVLENNLNTVIKNCENPFVSSVQVLFEGDSSLLESKVPAQTLESIRRLERTGRVTFTPVDGRPDYKTLFSRARGDSAFYLVANADIQIDHDTAAKLVADRYGENAPLFALTRWNLTANGRFLQAVSASPPWAEIPYEAMTYKDRNYLSYDTYVCGEGSSIPSSLSGISIGTFGCDTAIAALFRIGGAAVSNPCLSYRTTHIDLIPRNYASEAGTAQLLRNTEVVRQAILKRCERNKPLLRSLDGLTDLRIGVASFGTPHRLGIWHSLYRMLGATPWTDAGTSQSIRFVKLSIDGDSLPGAAMEVSRQVQEAMESKAFLEIEVSNGESSEHYLGLFGRHTALKELREHLYRYNWQSVLLLDHASEEERRIHADVLLLLKDLLGPNQPKARAQQDPKTETTAQPPTASLKQAAMPVSCPVCNGRQMAYRRTVKNVDVFACLECLSFCSPFAPRRGALDDTKWHVSVTERNLDWAGELFKGVDPTYVLEVGTGIGTILRAARERGGDGIGFDLDCGSVDYGKRAYGLDLRCEAWNAQTRLPRTPTAILCIMVLEKLHQPRELLADLLKAGKKYGCPVFVASRWFNKDWWPHLLTDARVGLFHPLSEPDVYVTHISHAGFMTACRQLGATEIHPFRSGGWPGFLVR